MTTGDCVPKFVLGQLVHLENVFTDPDTGDLVDPGDMTLTVEDPNGDQTVYDYPEDITRESLGVFYYDVDGSIEGVWKYHWHATGAGQAADDGEFEITSILTDEPEPTELDLLTLASAPKRVRTEEGTVEERSVDELIKADQYLKSQEALDAVPWGIRVARTKPGGTVT